MAIILDTRHYEASHGKRPRGYGMWAFAQTRDGQPMFFTGTYSAASRSARAWMVAKKISMMVVLP